MPVIKRQLLQRFRALGAMFVTFLCLAGTAGAELNLISPLAGLEDRLETVEPASDDLLTRLRYGFELP